MEMLLKSKGVSPVVRFCLGLVAVSCAVVSLAACAQEDALPAAGVIELSEQFTSEFDLIDHHGEPRTNEDFKGKVMLVYFGFATCPDVCPLALSRMTAALAELNDDETAQLQPLFITVDPERDTPAALKTYLAFDERVLGLTGSPAAAEAARRSFKTYAEKRPLPDSELGYTMDHYSLFYLVDRDGQPRVALQDELTPQQIAAAVRLALRWS